MRLRCRGGRKDIVLGMPLTGGMEERETVWETLLDLISVLTRKTSERVSLPVVWAVGDASRSSQEDVADPKRVHFG